jgi:predicted nucleic acid-binding Zn ribbon protein
MTTCQVCGVPFLGRSHKKTCSPRCKKALQRKRGQQGANPLQAVPEKGTAVPAVPTLEQAIQSARAPDPRLPWQERSAAVRAAEARAQADIVSRFEPFDRCVVCENPSEQGSWYCPDHETRT